MNEMSNHKKEEEEEAESVFYMTKPTRWINGRVHIVSCRHNFFLLVLYNALVLFGGRKKQKQSHPFSPMFTTTTTTKIFFFPSHTYFWHKSPRQSENPLCMLFWRTFFFNRWPSNHSNFNCSSLWLLDYYLDFFLSFFARFFLLFTLEVGKRTHRQTQLQFHIEIM